MAKTTKNRISRGIDIRNLCKHMFVCGTSGGGKTTAIFYVLAQLCAWGIPFIVIEGAKTEYRLLKALRRSKEPGFQALANAVQIFTPGVELLSPVRFNLLRCPAGIDLDEHVDQVGDCFNASMPMFEPLPALLAEAVDLVYSTHPNLDEPPMMDDLFDAAQQVLSGKSYSADLKSDLFAALEVRLGMLTRRRAGRILRSTECIPDISQLMTSYSVIELDPLGTTVKCLLTLVLLTAVQQYIRAHPWRPNASDRKPRLVIVIEEAHVIVGCSSEAAVGENQADPKAHATELVCRMLAEFRALGVGIILADQFPSQMAPQVIKSTGTKLAFRQVDREDRLTLADAMLLGDLDYEEIARLEPGQGFLFADGYHRAHRIRTPNLAELLNLPPPPDAQQLAALIDDENWFQEAATRRAGDALLRFGSAMDRFEKRQEVVRRELQATLERRATLPRISDPGQRRTTALDIATSMQKAVKGLAAAYTRLEHGPYTECLNLSPPGGSCGAQLETLRKSALRRFEEVIRPRFRRVKKFIDCRVAELKGGVHLRRNSNGQE